MTRHITSHVVNPVNDKLTITVVDQPGSGGASHAYRISGMDHRGNASYDQLILEHEEAAILFQNGPINEHGVNGITHEVLLAVLIDRLEGLQAGEFANYHNDQALRHLRQAQDTLKNRTIERMARGVEGKLEK